MSDPIHTHFDEIRRCCNLFSSTSSRMTTEQLITVMGMLGQDVEPETAKRYIRQVDRQGNPRPAVPVDGRPYGARFPSPNTFS